LTQSGDDFCSRTPRPPLCPTPTSTPTPTPTNPLLTARVPLTGVIESLPTTGNLCELFPFHPSCKTPTPTPTPTPPEIPTNQGDNPATGERGLFGSVPIG
jgi:hypothetical protein